ncbi:hydroxylase [Actinomadura rubrobrunea]|uniref:Hydroxylase n=1 Tax=Actinomadura rubrobrunea TaxID=115335 RepID=A0A9W6UUT9_9ACTN|nr:VOC family protein [Actinomadura rubrobrunea]GLW62015.1 hydroxylase [Actinomadura rubrobrunea]
MTEVSGYAPGAPCWVELASPKIRAARKFYGGVFGWHSHSYSYDFGDYHTWTLGKPKGPRVAGMRALAGTAQTSHWTCYFAVDDLGAAVRRVRAAGGQVIVEDAEVAHLGRLALAVDPDGVGFALWKGLAFQGAGVVDEPGALCWLELGCRDLDGAQRFYGDVLGWTFVERNHEGLTYSYWRVADRSVGGMVVLDSPLRPLERPQWMPYFAVEDCDACVAKAAKLGARVAVAPRDIRPGRYSIMRDPLGTPLAVIEPAR